MTSSVQQNSSKDKAHMESEAQWVIRNHSGKMLDPLVILDHF